MNESTPPLRIALIGTGFMGAAHSHAWRTAHRFFDLPLTPVMTAIVGRDGDRTRTAADRWGWTDASTDWHDVIARDDIDLVDICSPGDTHAEIALAALAAGKHVLCEKPLANTSTAAEQMADAADAAAARGLVAMCGFSYRRTPALALARRLIEIGEIGAVRHLRAHYLQDWLSDAEAPHTWRLSRAQAGSGALGDIAAHSIDTAQWLTGSRIETVSAQMRTFVESRPARASVSGLGGSGDASGARLIVDVDDAVAFTARFSDGALGVFEATRMALGRRNANRIEVNGDRGSIAFDFERMNELEFFSAADADDRQGFRTIHVTDATHPYTGSWWPVGHGLGYEHTFTHQAVDLVRAIAGEIPTAPTFRDALGVQRVLDAVTRSAADDSRSTSIDTAEESS